MSHQATPTGVRSFQLERRSLPFVLVALLAAFMLLLAVRGFLSPVTAASGFGIPLADAADAVFIHIKAGRDLGIGLTFIALLALRHRAALAATVAGALVVPINDGLQVMAHEQNRVAYALAVHGSAALYGVVLLVLLLRRSTAES